LKRRHFLFAGTWITSIALTCGLLTSCGGSTSATCAADQVQLESGCTSAAQVAETVRQVVRSTMQQLDLRAAIVGVSVGNQTVLMQAWGESAPGVPATTDMHWRIGAIAISYLSTVLLQLQDEGKLSLDDPLSKYLPDIRDAHKVTLRMLIQSTSGYPEYVNTIPIEQNVFRQWQESDLLADAFSKKSVCDPGTCFAYSHANFILLGEVLTKATGIPLATLIDQRILRPLQLDQTISNDGPDMPSPVLHAYASDIGSYQDSTGWNPSWTLAHGAIMASTIPEMLKSTQAIGSGALISARARAAMIAPSPVATGGKAYSGLGIVVANGWLLQNPLFYGYSGVSAYLDNNRISIAVTATTNADSPNVAAASRLFENIAAKIASSNPVTITAR
jgi:D-alanyl-D-alanine carboxypeptidase